MTPITPEKVKGLLGPLREWRLSGDGKSIYADWAMKDFVSAVALIQAIAPIAEAQDHHPDIHLTGYRKLRIELSTHSIGGLSHHDFDLAAKINQLPKQLRAS